MGALCQGAAATLRATRSLSRDLSRHGSQTELYLKEGIVLKPLHRESAGSPRPSVAGFAGIHAGERHPLAAPVLDHKQ